MIEIKTSCFCFTYLSNCPTTATTAPLATSLNPLRPSCPQKKQTSYAIISHTQPPLPLNSFSLSNPQEGESGNAGVAADADKRWMIVGFEAQPCSLAPDADFKAVCQQRGNTSMDNLVQVKADVEVTYTYTVKWKETDTPWASRWDAYLSTPNAN